MSKFQRGQSGNPKGRPKGIQDRRTRFRKLIEPHKEKLANKAIELALAGNEQMLRLLLDRLLPAKPKDDVLSELSGLEGSLANQGEQILALITHGTITPAEGNVLLHALMTQAKVVEFTELGERLAAIEKTLKLRGNNHEK